MDSTFGATAALGGGLLLLLWGAQVMVDHSVRLGRRLGLSTLVIGSTIIALGTSAPEFVVSFIAGLQGSAGIAVGNVVGSNISNLGLVLGVGVLITPFAVMARVIRVEYPVMLLVTVLASFFLWSHEGLVREEGWCLGALMVLLFALYLRDALRNPAEESAGGGQEEDKKTFRQSMKLHALRRSLFGHPDELPGWEHGGFALAGLILLLVGSQLTVDGAKLLCSRFGLSEAVVGATVVALGTSLPELATTVVAARRRDGAGPLILGNILGSNTINILLVLGATGSVVPLPISLVERSMMLPLLVGLTVVTGIFFVTQRRASRPLAVVLLATYAAFIVLSVLQAIDPGA